VDSSQERRDKRFYGIIAIVIIILIILTVIFSSNKITKAIIDDSVLNNGWSEDISERFYAERLFGLEKQASFTYKINNDTYPAYVSVTTIKTLFMMDESDLLDQTIKTIKMETNNLGINLNSTSKISGNRVLNNEHTTNYVIYNGTDNSKNLSEEIKIIGEAWNCALSGTSIICIGFAQVTDNSDGNAVEFLDNWARIIKDKTDTFANIYNSNTFIGSNGLIFNVICD